MERKKEGGKKNCSERKNGKKDGKVVGGGVVHDDLNFHPRGV